MVTNNCHALLAQRGAMPGPPPSARWLFLLAGFFAAQADGAGWAEYVAALQSPQPEASWRAAALPLSLMTKLSYTQTWGTYRGNQSEQLEGWRKLSFEANPTDGPCAGSSLPCDVTPSSGGMHALAFLSSDGTRLALAFRGTDLNPLNVSGRADSCSNHMRAGLTFDELGRRCHGFSYGQLDYVASARNFVRTAILAAHDELGPGTPEPDVLAVGHSLGATLALLMAIEFRFWAVGFGSSGVAASLHRCDGLHGSCAVMPAPSFTTRTANTSSTVSADPALCATSVSGRPTEEGEGVKGDGWSLQKLTVVNNPFDPVTWMTGSGGRCYLPTLHSPLSGLSLAVAVLLVLGSTN